MGALWSTITEEKQHYPVFEYDIEVDVAIIGGGITGITAAKQLIDSGKRVAVIDAHTIGGVTTGSSTGNLYVPVQPTYHSIEHKFNLETASKVAHSRQEAIEYIERTINEYAIECNFKRRPWYAYSNDLENDSLEQELTLFHQMEIEAEYASYLPLNVAFKKAIMLPNQARFNPLHYVRKLAEQLHKQGCFLFEHTRALKMEENDYCTITTEHAQITAHKIIIATHTPIGINPIQFFTAPYRSYVLAVALKENDYPEGQYVNIDNPSYALCTHPIIKNTPELLMIAGSHHKTGQGLNKNHYAELMGYLNQQFDVAELKYQWSAQHYQAADSIPYIGFANAQAKHTYIATGYFADGLVYGTLAGILLGDLLSNKEHPLAQVYNANRHDLLAATPFLLKEGSNMLLEYLADLPLYPKPNYKDLKQGEGKIVKVNRIKYAISRNSNNKICVVSAVCPHMKGIVNWNNAEQTWDCPLHGSRFSATGEIIEGPAMCSLHSKDAQNLEEDLT